MERIDPNSPEAQFVIPAFVEVPSFDYKEVNVGTRLEFIQDALGKLGINVLKNKQETNDMTRKIEVIDASTGEYQVAVNHPVASIDQEKFGLVA